MTYKSVVLFAFLVLLALPARAMMGEGGASLVLDGVPWAASCAAGPNGLCAPKTLSWDKGTTSYYPYAIFRLKSDNCGGGDGISYPGIKMACPVNGVGSTVVYPSVTPGCQGIIRYTLVKNFGNPVATCDQIDNNDDPIAEVDLTINPTP
jgi:hypothetical protein